MSQSERSFVRTLHVDRQENAGRLTRRVAALLAWALAEAAALFLLLQIVSSFPPWSWGGSWLILGPFLVAFAVLSAGGIVLVRELIELTSGRDEIAADQHGLTGTRIRLARRSFRHEPWSQVLDVALSADGRVVFTRTLPVSTWRLTRLGTEQQRAELVVDLKVWIASQPVTQPVDSVLPPYLPPGWRTAIRTEGLLLQEKPWRRRAQGVGFGLFAGVLWVLTEAVAHSAIDQKKPFEWFLGYLTVGGICLAISKLFTGEVWLVAPGSLAVGRAWLRTGRWVRSSSRVAALELGLVEVDESYYICLYDAGPEGGLAELTRVPDDKAVELRSLGHWLAITADLPLTDRTLSIDPARDPAPPGG